MVKGRKKNIAKKFLSILMLALFVFSTPLAFAQDGGDDNGSSEDQVLFQPVEKQIIQLTDEGNLEDWNVSGLETYGLKFLVRGKEALTWSLSIEDGGFHNDAIEKSYHKVLTIVNSMFILGLLAIALMWIFSILIPRKTLKKVILIYALAVVFINFALPLNQLFIDGTNLLQRTLLAEKDGNIQITDIVQTPAYADILSYQNNSENSLISGRQAQAMTLKLAGPDDEMTSIGKIRIPNGETIDEEVISLSNHEISLLKSSPLSVYGEQTFFRFGLLLLTGIAYFVIALIFVLRIVILWALLILSPVLLLLAIFRSTRGWFLNWLSMYGRWLLIGPIMALGIAVIVNIWQLSGLPITVSDTYTPEVFTAEKTSNIVFYLPGKDTANTLSNTQEMMEYLIFLLMLYLPIFLGFTLTRRKVLHESLVAVTKKLMNSTQTTTQQQLLIQQALAGQAQEPERRERPAGIVESFKHLVNDKISLLTESAMPINKLKISPEVPTVMMPTASNFLPENLAKTPVPKMLELLGMQKDSKASHKQTIERLARTESITDRKEREKVEAVMNEVRTRADNKDGEAMAILHEVETVKEVDAHGAEKGGVTEVHIDGGAASSISINVNDAKPEADRKVRDSSFDSKSAEKNKGSKEKNKKEERKDEQNDKKVEEKSDKPNPDDHAN